LIRRVRAGSFDCWPGPEKAIFPAGLGLFAAAFGSP